MYIYYIYVYICIYICIYIMFELILRENQFVHRTSTIIFSEQALAIISRLT